MHTTLMTERLPYRLAAVLPLILLSSGCSTTWDSVDLMPAPHVFGDGMLDPLPDSNPMEIIPYHGVLYATDRKPADEGSRQNYYADERGQLVRLGVATIALHEADQLPYTKKRMIMTNYGPRGWPLWSNRACRIGDLGIRRYDARDHY